MKKRPTPHLQRKRNKQLRTAHFRRGLLQLHDVSHRIQLDCDAFVRSMNELGESINKVRDTAQFWGKGNSFPERSIMDVVRDAPPIDLGASLPEGTNLIDTLQELIDARPVSTGRYPLVGTRAFFEQIGIDPRTLDADGPELSPEEIRKHYGL